MNKKTFMKFILKYVLYRGPVDLVSQKGVTQLVNLNKFAVITSFAAALYST